MDTVAVVLAGGTGTRLYPAARPDRPKQFLTLDGDRSLLERSLDRARFADRVAVVTREAYADRIADHAPPGVDPAVIVEPAPRDTGPALLYATRAAARLAGLSEADPGTVDDVAVIALPADHRVGDDDAFRAAAGRAATVAAATGRLVTLGIEPDRPATGYGYIEPGPERAADGTAYREVGAFHEKPDRETAAAYCAAGHRWNAGVFAWTPAALFAAAADTRLGPLAAALRERERERGREGDEAGDATAAAAFAAADPVSVDHAVLEPAADAGRVAAVEADFEWDDLGTWAAVARLAGLDRGNGDGDGDGGGSPLIGRLSDGNATLATGAPPGDGVATVDATDNLVATDDAHVSLIGVEGLAVVAFDDRVLVVPREEADRVREAVARLRDRDAY